MNTSLLFSISLALILAAAPSTAVSAQAPNDTCDQYARAAVEQNAAQLQRNCGFQGPRWNADYNYHYAWCTRVSAQQVQAEANARTEALQTQCALPASQPQGTLLEGTMLMVDPGEIWKPVDVTAGQQPATISPGAVHDAATFVRWTKMETNACKNAVKITMDRSGNFWKGEVGAQLTGDGTQSSGSFTTGSVATAQLSTLQYDDKRTPGPKNVELRFQLRTPDGQWLDASNPPYFLTLNRYRQPAVLSVVPSTVAVGTTTVVTITGKDFITPGQQTTVRLLSTRSGAPATKIRSLTPTVIQLQVTIAPGMLPDEYLVQVAKPCVANVDSPRLHVVKPSSPPPPSPPPPASTEKEVLVQLKRQPAPPSGGNVPYVGSINPVSGGVLQSITNGNTYLGKQWGVRLVKAGYTTNDCNNAQAVIDLPPGKTTTDFQGTSLGSGMPLAACIYPVSVAVPPPSFLALKVRYKK